MDSMQGGGARPAARQPGLDLPRPPHGLRGEDAGISPAWLAAAGTCRGAQPHQYPAVRRLAEDGCLRLDPRLRHVAGGRWSSCSHGWRRLLWSGSCTARCWHGVRAT
ncbi:hypothetical protein [Plasmodium yoelii yoelii]|uniref:Uncharacterized protein n=1 Tax=Plasmodium yoelii yoelii TaxID=73239 RepID=Q7R6Y1_PLAYO|nr:hypothetical protein [Plasmodium yoelii yoelii]